MMVTFSGMSFRDEVMAEKPGGLFAQLPLMVRWPEGGDLAAEKARARATDSIVLRNVVATDEPEPSGGCQGKWRTARFACDEEVRSCCHQSQQGPE
jgi:hypothetical protein